MYQKAKLEEEIKVQKREVIAAKAETKYVQQEVKDKEKQIQDVEKKNLQLETQVKMRTTEDDPMLQRKNVVPNIDKPKTIIITKQEPAKPLPSYLPKKDTTPIKEPAKPFVRERRQRVKEEKAPLPTIESIEPKQEPVKVETPKQKTRKHQMALP